ncbi:hypothetical protein ACQB60_40930 [Actinomycetota bacterium Odt1-20B]
MTRLMCAAQRLKDSDEPRRFIPGDRVRPREDTDHPEDPIGTVMVRLDTHELLVDFPRAGGEIYLDEHLDLVQAAPPGWKPPPPAPETEVHRD